MPSVRYAFVSLIRKAFQAISDIACARAFRHRAFERQSVQPFLLARNGFLLFRASGGVCGDAVVESPEPRFQVALAVAMYCFGFGWMSVSRLRHDVAWPAGLLTARAVVMSPPVMTAHAVRVRVMLADGIRSGCRAELTLHRADSLNECRLRPGDGILFRARVEPPRNSGNPGEFDYAGYLRRQGISGRAYVPPDAWTRLPEARSLRKRLPLWPRLQLMARMQQQQLADRYYRKLPQDEAALLAALSVGYRSAFPKDLRMQFSAVGVSHVLALSGLHLGILVGVFLYVSPRRRSWRVAYYGLVVLMIAAFACWPVCRLRWSGPGACRCFCCFRAW